MGFPVNVYGEKTYLYEYVENYNTLPEKEKRKLRENTFAKRVVNKETKKHSLFGKLMSKK